MLIALIIYILIIAAAIVVAMWVYAHLGTILGVVFWLAVAGFFLYLAGAALYGAAILTARTLKASSEAYQSASARFRARFLPGTSLHAAGPSPDSTKAEPGAQHAIATLGDDPPP